jgi:hypothetical protein
LRVTRVFPILPLVVKPRNNALQIRSTLLGKIILCKGTLVVSD